MARRITTCELTPVPGLPLPLGPAQDQSGPQQLPQGVPGPQLLPLPPAAQLPCAYGQEVASTKDHAATEDPIPCAAPHQPHAARRDGTVPSWAAFLQDFPELSGLSITAFLNEFCDFLERVANGACPLDPAVLAQIPDIEDTPVSTPGPSSPAELLPELSKAEAICAMEMEDSDDTSCHGAHSPASSHSSPQAPDLLQHWVHIRRSRGCSEAPMLGDADPFCRAPASPLQDTQREQEPLRGSADLLPQTPLSPSGTAEESSLQSSAHSSEDTAEPQGDRAAPSVRKEPLAAPTEQPLLSPRSQHRLLQTRLQLRSTQAPAAPQQHPTCKESLLREARHRQPRVLSRPLTVPQLQASATAVPQHLPPYRDTLVLEALNMKPRVVLKRLTVPRPQAPADAHQHPSRRDTLVQEALNRQPRVLLSPLQLPLGRASCQGLPALPEAGSSLAKRPEPARTRSQKESSQHDRSPPSKRRKMELRRLSKR